MAIVGAGVEAKSGIFGEVSTACRRLQLLQAAISPAPSSPDGDQAALRAFDALQPIEGECKLRAMASRATIVSKRLAQIVRQVLRRAATALLGEYGAAVSWAAGCTMLPSWCGAR